MAWYGGAAQGVLKIARGFVGQGGPEIGHVLYTTFLGFDEIDFNETVFFSGSKMSGKTYYHFDDYESWKKHRDDSKTALISAEKITLKKEYADSDIIETRLGGPFVSERLLDRWTSFNVTGFVINKEPILDIA